MNKLLLSLFAASTIFFTGCIPKAFTHQMSTQSLAYDSVDRAPTAESSNIEIIHFDSINRDFEVIGEVVIVSTIFNPAERMHSRLIEEAREMGGDAITNFTSKVYNSDQPVSDDIIQVRNNEMVWKAKVIVWQN